jgi:TetR/AcrR family transcriptional regulator, acrAB operon repressor
MVRKTKEEALETRNQLLDAAEDVFYREGYARTTLDAVAEAARMTRGAIYWHFKNKSDLFNAMCDRVRLPMEEITKTAFDEGIDDPLSDMRKNWVFFFKECENNPHLRKVMDILIKKTEFVDPTDPMYIRQHEAFLQGRDYITRWLSLAVESGQLSQDLNIHLAAIFLQSNVEGILLNWLITPDHFSLASEAERLVDACIDTVRNASTLRKPR